MRRAIVMMVLAAMALALALGGGAWAEKPDDYYEDFHISDELWATSATMTTAKIGSLELTTPLDHGGLSGKSDDDHPQYHNDTRGDARYAKRSNNLSDLNSAATARTNLGLGTAATTDSTAYATAAQGSTADSAVQPGDDADTLGSGGAADNQVLTADGATGAAWETPDHGNLAGKSDDDHPQYAGIAQTEVITGAWKIDSAAGTATFEIEGVPGSESRLDLSLNGDSQFSGIALSNPAPQYLSFYHGDAEKGSVDSSGNLQIDGNLDVDGTGAQVIEGYLDQNSTTGNDFAGALRCTSTNDSYTMGQFGIGTNSPDRALLIVGEEARIDNEGAAYFTADRSTTESGAAFRCFTDGSSTGFFGNPYGGNNNDLSIGRSFADNDIVIDASTGEVTVDQALHLTDSLDQNGTAPNTFAGAMQCSSTSDHFFLGNVCIGDTSPGAYSLKLVGTNPTIYADGSQHAYFNADRGSSTYDALVRYRTAGTTKFSSGLAASGTAYVLSSTGGDVWSVADASLNIAFGGNVSANGYLRLGSTSAPSYGLDMRGDYTQTLIYQDSTGSVGHTLDRGAASGSLSIAMKTAGMTAFSLGMSSSSTTCVFASSAGDVWSVADGSTTLTVANDIYVTDHCSAARFTDRTPAWGGTREEALSAVAGVRSVTDAKTGRAEIDHSSLPEFARGDVVLEVNPSTAAVVIEPGRDIGAMTTLHTVGIQALKARNEAVQQRASQAENRLTIAEAELAATRDRVAALEAGLAAALKRVEALEDSVGKVVR